MDAACDVENHITKIFKEDDGSLIKQNYLYVSYMDIADCRLNWYNNDL